MTLAPIALVSPALRTIALLTTLHSHCLSATDLRFRESWGHQRQSPKQIAGGSDGVPCEHTVTRAALSWPIPICNRAWVYWMGSLSWKPRQ